MRMCIILLFFVVAGSMAGVAQQAQPELTIEFIMRDPAWMGTPPTDVFWSERGDRVYFKWRREGDSGDSLYAVPAAGGTPVKVSWEERKTLPPPEGDYTADRTRKVYVRDGDLVLLDVRRMKETPLTKTVEVESHPGFTHSEEGVVYEREGNLWIRDLASGLDEQVTNFVRGQDPAREDRTELQRYIAEEALTLSDVLQKRKREREESDKTGKGRSPSPYYLGTQTVSSMVLSSDKRFVTFVLTEPARSAKRTSVPSYVTESGFTEVLTVRTKVGEPLPRYRLAVYDRRDDTVRIVKPEDLPEIQSDADSARRAMRDVRYSRVVWSPDGKHGFLQIFSQDNKDRWIVMIQPDRASLGAVVDHQHDDAWIGGPGIGFFGGNTIGWMPDSKRIYFQSEADGWSHLYVAGIDGSGRKQLTRGAFEVYQPVLSKDRKRWFFASNEVHFGERHFFTMPLEGGVPVRITSMEGRSDVKLSPDETRLAVLHSFSNRMPELFVMENRAGGRARQVTDSPSGEFRSYPWRAPRVLTISAQDGAEVPARLYVPERPNGAAVIFVHGAGYLQNAHKWWSSYFREYMFHNLLADRGFTVLDMDYRASAGRGRDWRTAIYRQMGGKDLDDNVDGARWLVKNHGIDPNRIGIYGGSYGGFITLMALFTQPGVFAAGAALRPVTDWAHYNQGYTSAILNIPQEDTVAYRRSSPIYHAEGLEGALLICHGMVDVNVHYQDAVRLVQRLIELKKERWEFASYPLEDHGFKEETSWMDEYKRILKLFEENLGETEGGGK